MPRTLSSKYEQKLVGLRWSRKERTIVHSATLSEAEELRCLQTVRTLVGDLDHRTQTIVILIFPLPVRLGA